MNNKDLFFIHHFYAFIIKLFVIFISYYPKSSKLWKSLEMKEKSLTRFKDYFQNRKNKQKYILFHVASAGGLKMMIRVKRYVPVNYFRLFQ